MTDTAVRKTLEEIVNYSKGVHTGAYENIHALALKALSALGAPEEEKWEARNEGQGWCLYYGFAIIARHMEQARAKQIADALNRLPKLERAAKKLARLDVSNWTAETQTVVRVEYCRDKFHAAIAEGITPEASTVFQELMRDVAALRHALTNGGEG